MDGFEILNGEVVVRISFDAVDINNAKNIKLKYEGGNGRKYKRDGQYLTVNVEI